MAQLGSHAEGLSASEARERLGRYGENQFRDAPPPHLLLQLLRRFGNPFVLLLLFAGAVSAVTGDAVSAAIIAAIVVMSVFLDFVQEYRAERAAEGLKQSVALCAVVLRDGREQDIAARGVVPGDVVVLRAGQLVPADGRVLSAQDLFVNQAVLTGETYPVEKRPEALTENDALLQAENALFMGASVVSGSAVMLVCATGAQTQVGHVARTVAAARSETAFERGIKVLVCTTGISGHLAAAVAARTVLPVIGVPIGSDQMPGDQSIYVTAQMPSGVPVATVGSDAAVNGAVLAAQIVGITDPDLQARLWRFKDDLAEGLRM